MKDLERALKEFQKKQLRYQQLFNYYEGDQPLVYSAARLKAAFGDTFARFEQNWCSVVVDATLDRLVLKGFDINNDKAADNELDELWSGSDLEVDADDVHKDALIAGESYVIGWKGIDGEIEVYRNSPLMCHLFYKQSSPKIKDFGAKIFQEGERWHITLYYPDRLEYYVSNGADLPSEVTGFKTEEKIAANPFGVVPVFHFKWNGSLRNIITIQDAINKLFADMMVAAEYGAFKQRWVVSNADLTALKNNPNEIWTIPAGDGVGQSVSVGEFAGEELTKFMNSIDKLANTAAIITRTPKQYLSEVGAGISGDALIAMEAPLVKKVEKIIKRFNPTWKELAVFLLKLNEKTVAKKQILPIWGRVKSEQPLAELQAINFGTSSGVPLVTMLRKQGWEKAEIEQMLKDKAEEKKANASTAKSLLDEARNNLDQNNDPGVTGNSEDAGDVDQA